MSQLSLQGINGEIIRSRVYMFLVLFKPSPAATIRKKQAKQLEALASPRPTILIHGKANRNIRFGLHRAGAAAVHKDFHVLKIVSPGASLELD